VEAVEADLASLDGVDRLYNSAKRLDRPRRRRFVPDSSLEGTGFELPVRGCGQSDCCALCGSSVPPARCDKSRRRRIPRASAFQPRPSSADKRLHRSSQCWFSIAMTACAAKFCNSAICLSEAGVPPHSGAHRAAKSAPSGGGQGESGGVPQARAGR